MNGRSILTAVVATLGIAVLAAPAASASTAAITSSARSGPASAEASAVAPADSVCTQDIGDPTGLENISTVRSTTVTVSGRTLTIELRRGYTAITNVEYAWTRISNARAGDGLWIDITEDSTATHAQCGETTSPGTGQWWTDAFQTSSYASTQMRACGGILSNGVVYFNCTTWW